MKSVRRAQTAAWLALAATAACNAPPSVPVVFSAHAIDRDTVRPCTSGAGCAEIHLSWVEASGGPPRVAERINAVVFELMRAANNRPTSANTPELIAQAFQRDFLAFRHEHPGDDVPPWTMMTAVSLPWRSERGLLTLDAPMLRHQGGPHGVSQERLRVVDMQTGRALGLRDIIADEARATEVVERFFRRDKRVPLGESLAEYGWYFDHDRFALPADIGLNNDGVIFHWDPSVIGPYIAGMTTLVVPYDSLRSELSRRVLP